MTGRRGRRTVVPAARRPPAHGAAGCAAAGIPESAAAPPPPAAERPSHPARRWVSAAGAFGCRPRWPRCGRACDSGPTPRPGGLSRGPGGVFAQALSRPFAGGAAWSGAEVLCPPGHRSADGPGGDAAGRKRPGHGRSPSGPAAGPRVSRPRAVSRHGGVAVRGRPARYDDAARRRVARRRVPRRRMPWRRTTRRRAARRRAARRLGHVRTRPDRHDLTTYHPTTHDRRRRMRIHPRQVKPVRPCARVKAVTRGTR